MGRSKRHKGKQESKKKKIEKPLAVPLTTEHPIDEINSAINSTEIPKEEVIKPNLLIPKPDFMADKPIPGTLGAEEAKDIKTASIAAAVIAGIVILLMYFNVFHTYLWDYQHRAGGFDRVVGFICLLVSGSSGFIYKKFMPLSNAKIFALLFFIPLVLGIAWGSGFNFDLHGIEPGA